MPNTKTTEFCAGALIRKHVRQTLDQFIFTGLEIEYLENKGWIDSTFILKGSDGDLRKVINFLSKSFE
jgi:hypothetical protein